MEAIIDQAAAQRSKDDLVKSIEIDYATCDYDADHIYGVAIAGERARGIRAGNFEKAKAATIHSCMISKGWVYRLKYSGDYLGCGAFCYAPRDAGEKSIIYGD